MRRGREAQRFEAVSLSAYVTYLESTGANKGYCTAFRGCQDGGCDQGVTRNG